MLVRLVEPALREHIGDQLSSRRLKGASLVRGIVHAVFDRVPIDRLHLHLEMAYTGRDVAARAELVPRPPILDVVLEAAQRRRVEIRALVAEYPFAVDLEDLVLVTQLLHQPRRSSSATRYLLSVRR